MELAQVEIGREVVVDIKSYAHQGEGWAGFKGFTVFVPAPWTAKRCWSGLNWLKRTTPGEKRLKSVDPPRTGWSPLVSFMKNAAAVNYYTLSTRSNWSLRSNGSMPPLNGWEDLKIFPFAL